MAQELRIIIEDRIGGGGEVGRGGGAVGEATFSSIAGASAQARERESIDANIQAYKAVERAGADTSNPRSVNFSERSKGLFRRQRTTMEFEAYTGAGTESEIFTGHGYGTSHTQDFMYSKEGQRLKQSGKGMAIATTRAIVDHQITMRKYTSGDAYHNAQLDNMMKGANYAASLGMAGVAFGPIGIGVAGIGITINEVANFAKQSQQFKYDRQLEGFALQNAQAIAGNISYGRPRGGG